MANANKAQLFEYCPLVKVVVAVGRFIEAAKDWREMDF